MKYIKRYWWLILVLALAGYIIYLNTRISNIIKENQIQAVELATMRDSISVLVDKNGELTFKFSSVEIDNSNLKEAIEIAGYDIKKLKDKDVEWRKITNALRLQLESSGHGETPIIDTMVVVKTDSIRYSKFSWTNDYLSFSGNIQDDRLTFDYKYKTDLTILQTKKKNTTVVSVILSDPLATITSANSITVANSRKWWDKWWIFAGAGLTAGILITK